MTPLALMALSGSRQPTPQTSLAKLLRKKVLNIRLISEPWPNRASACDWLLIRIGVAVLGHDAGQQRRLAKDRQAGHRGVDLRPIERNAPVGRDRGEGNGHGFRLPILGWMRGWR